MRPNEGRMVPPAAAQAYCPRPMTDRRISTPLRALTASAALFALGGALAPGYAEDIAPAALAAPGQQADAAMPRFEATPVVQEIEAPDSDAFADEGDAWEQYGAGVASYYAAKFDGRRTASGETFRNSDYTAAHRTLPFGTRVRVTRGDRSVVVRINDRGPFTQGRVIDVSQAAARDLGLIGPGHAPVTLALLAE